VQKAWKAVEEREMFIAHKISTLLFIFRMSFTPCLLFYFLFSPQPSIDETWFEYIFERFVSLHACHIHTLHIMIVIITKQRHRPHQHCISLTCSYKHPTPLGKKHTRKRKGNFFEENEFKARERCKSKVKARKCLMAPTSNPKKFANDTED
jgi:hypothetical protein